MRVRFSWYLVDEFGSLHTDDILSMSIMMNILATGKRVISLSLFFLFLPLLFSEL